MRSASRRVRARLRHAALTAAPVWLSRGRLARVRSDRSLAITHRTLMLPDLPDSLDGLRITHLSDLHIGRLTTPAHLPHIVETVHRAGGDLIAVTGDFVDLSLNVLDDVVAALVQLKAPLGAYMVPGNHDYLDDGPELVRRFRGAGLKMLINESVHVTHMDQRIAIAGIDFAYRPSQLARLIRHTIRPHANGSSDLSILLTHHPDAFDQACKRGVDVTLSGHTHGGQLVLSDKRGGKGSIGLGSLAFQYPRGLYRRGESYLYVTSGIGSWFPLRVRCPAEVACLTLRSGPVDVAETLDN